MKRDIMGLEINPGKKMAAPRSPGLRSSKTAEPREPIDVVMEGHERAPTDYAAEKDVAALREIGEVARGERDQILTEDEKAALNRAAETRSAKGVIETKTRTKSELIEQTREGVERERVAKLEAEEQRIKARDAQEIRTIKGKMMAVKEATDPELEAVKNIYVPEFSPEHHKKLEARQNELIDQLKPLKPWNFLKKRAIVKELNDIGEQMLVTYKNYAELKKDLARARQDMEHGDPKLKNVFAAEAKKIERELQPLEDLVAKATHTEAAIAAEKRRQVVGAGSANISAVAGRGARNARLK